MKHDVDKLYTRKEIQEDIYNEMGIPKDQIIPTYRDKIDKSFTLKEVGEMGEDEFNHYFDMGHSVGIVDKGKSSFKDANKKMKSIEEKQADKSVVSKMSAVINSITYESYLKSTTPKSSFKKANEKMKKFEA